MTNNRSLMHRNAMLMGTWLGGFWIFKFIFFPLGLLYPFCSMIFMGLTISMPYMAYKWVNMYRDNMLGGSITFAHAYMFSLYMFLFASLLTTIAHYVYFAFIDQGFLYETYSQTTTMLEVQGGKEIQELTAQFNEALDAFKTLTPIDITLNIMSWNFTCGIFLSLIIALFVKKK